MKMKCCPLLVQSITTQSIIAEGEMSKISYFQKCIGENCAAFKIGGFCEKFKSLVVIRDDTKGI